jgi:hypothetical protein
VALIVWRAILLSITLEPSIPNTPELTHVCASSVKIAKSKYSVSVEKTTAEGKATYVFTVVAKTGEIPDEIYVRMSGAALEAGPTFVPEATISQSCNSLGLENTIKFSEIPFSLQGSIGTAKLSVSPVSGSHLFQGHSTCQRSSFAFAGGPRRGGGCASGDVAWMTESRRMGFGQ